MAIKKVCVIELDDAEYILCLLKAHREGLAQWGEWVEGEFVWKDQEVENEFDRVLEIINRMEN